MKKQLLKERFQQLAGLKPLYGLNESSDAYDTWQSTLSKIKDNDEALEYAANHFGSNLKNNQSSGEKLINAAGKPRYFMLSNILSWGDYGEMEEKIQALNKDPKWQSILQGATDKKPGFLGKMFGKK
jgi:hypothetical protein